MISTISARAFNNRTAILAALVLYFVGLFLNSAWLFPNIGEMNYWDEIVYIASGKDLYEHGASWPYSRGPVISFIYAAIYPFLDDTEYWLLASDVIGRILAYTSLFVIAWLIGKELEHRELAPPLLVVGLFTAVPVFLSVITNPSYWTFMVFVSAALWLLLVYARTQNILALAMNGVAIGLTLMSRPDIIIFGSFIISVVLVTRPWQWSHIAGAILVAAAVPAAIIGGYTNIFMLLAAALGGALVLFLRPWRWIHLAAAFVLVTALFVTIVDHGGSKFYVTFEHAQQILLKHEEKALDFEKAASAEVESRHHFGTPEENKNSVLRAIIRNPSRFLLMVWTNTVDRTGTSLMQGYGQRTTPVVENVHLPGIQIPIRKFGLFIFFFAILGVIELLRRRHWILAAVLVIWLADLSLYLLTISFSAYYVFHFMVVFLLAAVGIWAGLGTGPLSIRRPATLAAWAGVILLVCYLDWNPNGRIFYFGIGGGVFLATIVLFRSSVENFRGIATAALVTGLMLVNIPVQYRLTWPGKDIGYLAQAKYLKENYPPLTPTLAYPGAAAVSAKMWWIGAWPDLAKIKSKEDFKAAMELVGTPLITTDPFLRMVNIYGLHESIKKYSSTYYRVGYESPDGRYKVLVPRKLMKTKVVPRS